jgi:hypothetical protein
MAIKLEMHLTKNSMDFAKYFILVYNSILMILFVVLLSLRTKAVEPINQ